MNHFTVERFLGGVGDVVMREHLLAAFQTGYQLKVSRLDYQVVPVVLILAAYALHHEEAEIVDDYEALVSLFREAVSDFGNCAAPDLFMATCISILHKRQEFPGLDTFYSIGIPQLFEAMVVAEEASCITSSDDL